MRKPLCLSLALSLLLQTTAFAVPQFETELHPPALASEYIYHSTMRENLIPVQVFGSVGKPGLYFVPPHTDLMKVLTLAGGADANSEDNIIVRKSDQTWKELSFAGIKKDGAAYQVDIKRALKEANLAELSMSAQDVIFVPHHESWIDGDTYRAVAIVSMLMGIVLTGYLINQNAKK